MDAYLKFKRIKIKKTVTYPNWIKISITIHLY